MSSQPEEKKQTRLGRGKRTEGDDDGATKKGNDRPKTGGRGRGGKSDNARGGQDGQKPGRGGRGDRRPQTGRQAAAAGEMEETKGPAADQGNNRGGKNQPRKQQEKKPQDKDSWIYKYHNMERPQYEKVAFTAETEIPALPTKKDLLKEPAKADFDREMALQDNLIQEKRSKKDSLIKQKRTVREGGLTAGGNTTKKGELTERINEVKGIRANKRAKQDAMRDIVSSIQACETEKRALLKSMHANCHTVEAVQQEIRDSERRLTTTSLNAQSEAKLCKEIEVLKASVPKAKRFTELDNKIKGFSTKKNEIYGEVKKIKAAEDKLNKEMEEIRKELEVTNAEKDVTRGELDALQKVIEGIDEELNSLYAKKDEKREAYWKGRYDFKKQREEIMHIEWMQRQKDKVINADAIKKEREEERQDVIKSMPHPYQKELDCCEHLQGYIRSLQEKAGLIVRDADVARQAQSAQQKEAVREKLDAKLTAGKVQVAQTKAEREAAATMQIGGKQNKKGKKQKKVVEYEEVFQLDLVIIKKFAMLNINAPENNDDLEDRLKKIAERKEWFEQNGITKLQEQIEELNSYAEEESKAYEQEEVEEQDESSRGRGRRGGRGGYQGGRGGASRRGRGGLSGYAARNEFEGEEDDDQIYSAPPTKAKRNKQKVEDLKMDEDNYPTL